MTTSTKPTTTFWIISVLALVWNSMGVMAYVGQAYMNEEAYAALEAGEQAYHDGVPAWVTAAFAIAVFAGALGCIALLMKKKWANSLFLLSFIAVIVQFIYNFFLQEFVTIEGTDLIWSAVVILIALFLVWYAKKSTSNGWLA